MATKETVEKIVRDFVRATPDKRKQPVCVRLSTKPLVSESRS
jgi:hypothetical protein